VNFVSLAQDETSHNIDWRLSAVRETGVWVSKGHQQNMKAYRHMLDGLNYCLNLSNYFFSLPDCI